MLRAMSLFILLMSLFSCNRGKEQAISTRPPAGKIPNEITVINTITNTADIGKIIRTGNLYVQNAPDSAVAQYLQALKLCNDYPEGRAMIYNNLSICYQNKKDYNEANYYLLLFKAELNNIPSPLYNIQERGHKKLLVQKYNYRAIDYYEAGNYDSATIWYVKTINAVGQADSSTYNTLVASYAGCGAIAGRLMNEGRALSYFNHAETIADQYGDSSLLVMVLSNKATVFMQEKNYPLAIATAQKGWNIAQRIGKSTHTTGLTSTIAISLIKQGKPEEALPYGKIALQLATERHTEEDQISAHYVLGFNYVELREYQQAEKHLLAGLHLALSKGQLDNITNAYSQLAAAYEGMGQYEKALQYQKKYTAIRDSLLGHENAERIAEVETRYHVAQKNKELEQKDKALLQNELKIASQRKQQYLWIGITTVSVLVLLGLLHRRRYKAQLNELRATIAGEEKERTRLARELHDGIVSRLSIIKMNFSALPLQYKNLSETGEFQEIVNQLEQSISELRNTSHNLLPEILQRAGLVESLRIYCDKIRKIALLDIEFQLVGEFPILTDEFQLNIYRIIQELVNNIIKHSNASHALIQFQVREEWLIITIDDDGNRNNIPNTATSTGIGLQNLHDRVRLLNGTVEMEHNSSSVYLEFNMKKYLRKV